MGRTTRSVTDIPCTCGYLEQSANDPDIPIDFEEQTSEYRLNYKNGWLIIYHCPFCGGMAPELRRKPLYVAIPSVEKKRLADLLSPIESLQQAIDIFGPPQRDDFILGGDMPREVPNCPPTVEGTRYLYYTMLSQVAEVMIMEIPNDRPKWMLVGKRIGE
jgi:hypothetical protein